MTYPVYGVDAGFFEQDPVDWTGSILSAVNVLRTMHSEEQWQNIESIGLSAQMPTMVLMGADDEILDRAIVWCDARAEVQGKICLPFGERNGITAKPVLSWMEGTSFPCIDGSGNISRSFCKTTLYFVGERLSLFLDVRRGGYRSFTASGFAVYNINTGDWDQELCSEAGISMKSLPKIMDSDSGTLHLRDQICKAFGLHGDIPVCIGAADSVAGVLGLGAVEPGMVCQICGSSTAVIGICDRIRIDPEDKFFITPLAKREPSV